mmetsp:Transcript_46453/g.104713  ORF Transcript_46453/g.104713 Transcript_46453/m.104713 type:complete len:192 (-) Transcript_46453:299-874(-)
MYSGLATHFVPSEQIPHLEEALQSCVTSSQVSEALTKLGGGIQPEGMEDAPLLHSRAVIDACFGADSIAEIQSRLTENAGDFAQVTLRTLRKMSPLSLTLTLRLLRAAPALSLAACLEADFRTSQHCMRPESDFFEGIRAALVDKDRNPIWSVSSVDDLTEEQVESFFAPLGERELTLPTINGFQSVQCRM